MTATQPAPDVAPENVNQTGAPNQYHLHAHGTQISYYPDGAGPPTADGPIILAYQDTDYSATFRGSQAHVVAVEGVGTYVTVTPQITADVGSRGHRADPLGGAWRADIGAGAHRTDPHRAHLRLRRDRSPATGPLPSRR